MGEPMEHLLPEEAKRFREEQEQRFEWTGQPHSVEHIEGLTEKQRAQVLEVMAVSLWKVMLMNGNDGHCKSYDPLTIDPIGKVASSYVFDLWDGDRHHSYSSFRDVETFMVAETGLLIREENGDG